MSSSKRARGRLKDDGTVPPKRQRLLMGADDTGDAFPNFLLNSDVSSEIFSFLDIRSLYNVTMTSRLGMRLLRHEHVVRSALMQGGHSKTCMERLFALIEKRCIWIPSPLRMLRLVNGRTCERCCTGRVHLVNENYGVFFCFHGCIQNDVSTKGVAMNRKWSPFVVDQPRVAKAAYSSSAYIWKRPYVDAAGERCGPLLSMIELERIMQGQGSIETLLREKDASDPYADEKSISSISRVFKDTTEAALQRIRERKQKKLQASVHANDRRKKKVMAMIDTLRTELDDVPWKDAVLSHSWIISSSKHVPHFDCRLTNELLREYSNAPSKATKKKLTEVTMSLRRSVRTLESKGFLDLSFLSDANPAERAVKEYCNEEYPNCAILKVVMHEWTMQRIASEDQSVMFKILLYMLPVNLVTILAPVIVSRTMAIQSEERRKKAITQVELLSKFELGPGSHIFWTYRERNPRMTPRELYNTLVNKFPQLVQNEVDFLHAPETISRIEERQQGSDQNPAMLQRLERVLERVWGGVFVANGVIDNLLKRDYKALVDVLLDLERQT